MTIPAELATYANEADFRDRFLVPLIRRLGYFTVDIYHGPGEFGRDLIFAEIDRFNDVIYHGLQAKFESSIGQGDSMGLVDDCREAFLQPFRHPRTGATHHISRFYIANAGTFSDNAKSNIFQAAMQNQNAGHVRLLDGPKLLELDRWASVNRVDGIGSLLMGLRHELANNAQRLAQLTVQLGAIVEAEKTPIGLGRLFTVSGNAYLQRPWLARQIDPLVVREYVENALFLNLLLDYLGMPLIGNRAGHAAGGLRFASELSRLGPALIGAIDIVSESLGPLADL